MKYLQVYKHKEIKNDYLELETKNSNKVLLTKEESKLYSYFALSITLEDAYQCAYGNDSSYIEFFNTSITKWYQLGILISI